MAIETVTSETGEIVSLDEFRRELGIWDGADDSRAQLLLESSRSLCERWGEVCLRLSATRTYSTESWPTGGWVLRHPPVTAITSITYYDTDNASQTLASGNYQANITEAGFAMVEFTANATMPSLYDRQDAVTVTYTTGWTSAANAPAAAKYAIILTGQSLDEMADSPRMREVIERQSRSLLSTVSAPSYA